MRVAVIGSGSWGTALAVLLARNGHPVCLAGRDAEEVHAIRSLRENVRYLPGFAIPELVTPLLMNEVEGEFDLWVIAVPAGAVESVIPIVRGPEASVLLASKGLVPHSGGLLSTVAEAQPQISRVAAISGPNLAIEIMRGIPTASVVASRDAAQAESIAQAFNCRSLRAYISDDLVGVELAGALKNVLAISAGMSDGLGYGDNTKGALVARGLLEMTRFGVKLGAKPETFFGIAGVGDLFATANSKLSRNYRVGYGLGQGRTAQEVVSEMGQVAEGVPSSEAAASLARRLQIQVPIFEMTDMVIRGRLSPRDGVGALMDRMPKREGWETVTIGSESGT